MANFNVVSDFIGEFNISQNKYATTDYTSVIATTEEKILKDLLGEDLYMKLIATPTTAPYADLVNGKTYSVVNIDGVTVNINYQGIKKMLKYFTYAELLRYQETENTEVGQVEPSQTNSVRMAKNNLSAKISEAYNKGVKLYGFDIETYGNNASLIRGLRDSTVKKYTEYDYYSEIVKGTAFNYLYYCEKNFPSYFPTWQFSKKDLSFCNGYL